MTRSHSPRPALTDLRETLIGALVLGALAVVFVLNAADRGREAGDDGYTLTASFQRTDGIAVGAPVRLAGMRVGEVTGQTLAGGFRAELTLRLDPGVEIPADSAAVIETDGLLGPKYIEIHPGGEEDLLPPGGRFDYAQDAMVLEDLLARIVEQARQKAQGRAEQTAPGTPGGDDDDLPDPTGTLPGGAGGLVPSLRDLLNNRTEDGDKALEHLPDTTPNGVLPPPDPRPGQPDSAPAPGMLPGPLPGSGGRGQTGGLSDNPAAPAVTRASLTAPAPLPPVR